MKSRGSKPVPMAALLFALAWMLLPGACTTFVPQERLLSSAESSGFKETTGYHRVMEILRLLENQSPLLRVETYGYTAEGRAMPLAVLGNPLPDNADEARGSGKTVVFINANIHAGEVAGKEACLMLIREITQGTLANLLDDTIVLVAPIYNADGNERIDPSNRYWQNGPERGVGIRTSAQSLDLNRDMMKLETPEARNLVRNILMRWNPHVVVDCHTTNGSYHTEPITYSPALTPLADAGLLQFNSQIMLPWIARRTQEKHGYASIPYGNFRDAMNPELGWYTFDHKPRYVSNYICLRNQLSILIEMYAYAGYETRIRACLTFLQSILEFCGKEGAAVRNATAHAETATLAAAEPGQVSLRFHTAFEQRAYPDPILIQGFRMELKEMENGKKQARPILDQPVKYSVPYYGCFVPLGEGAPLPDSYFFPRALFEIRDKLEQHGIVVNEIKEPFTATLSVFAIEKITFDNELFQGHRLQRLEGEWKMQSISFPGGAFCVSAHQPLARLAAYLLEPESDDGLACWNFLDRYLTRGPWDSRPGTYPVMKRFERVR
ncbi:MAG: M14 family metallopeptidase [Planctomycetota bacterium]